MESFQINNEDNRGTPMFLNVSIFNGVALVDAAVFEFVSTFSFLLVHGEAHKEANTCTS